MIFLKSYELPSTLEMQRGRNDQGYLSPKCVNEGKEIKQLSFCFSWVMT